jgi:hypothetical protein
MAPPGFSVSNIAANGATNGLSGAVLLVNLDITTTSVM